MRSAATAAGRLLPDHREDLHVSPGSARTGASSWFVARHLGIALQKAFVMAAAADHILSGGKECSIESLDARAQASLESLTGMKQLQIHLN
jgi:hypothetical protein